MPENWRTPSATHAFKDKRHNVQSSPEPRPCIVPHEEATGKSVHARGTEEERRSGYHWFLHANMNMFGPNDYIDYPRLVLSDGSLQLPFGMKATAIHADKLELEWLDNTSTVTAQATDQLTVAAIFDNEPYQPVVLDDTGILPIKWKSHRTVPEGDRTTAHLYYVFSLPKTGTLLPLDFSTSKS